MIKINLGKAKEIAHTKRREARDLELAPLDLKSTIPSIATEVEQKRQTIRDKYALLQTELDEASTVDELITLVKDI